MRYMVMHKSDEVMEAGGPPQQDIIQGMGKFIGESIKAGVFQNGAGLHGSAQRLRLGFKGGQRTTKKGPYTGSNELVAAFFLIRAASLDEASERAANIAAIVGDVEIEVGRVVEPWDLGMVPKPAEPASARFLLLQKGDDRTESGAPLEPDARQALIQLEKQWLADGVLLAAEKLAPSSHGARLPSGPKGKRTWIDGPFAESKELIAGFSLIIVPTKADALAWAENYAAILDGNEVDVREVMDSELAS